MLFAELRIFLSQTTSQSSQVEALPVREVRERVLDSKLSCVAMNVLLRGPKIY